MDFIEETMNFSEKSPVKNKKVKVQSDLFYNRCELFDMLVICKLPFHFKFFAIDKLHC